MLISCADKMLSCANKILPVSCANKILPVSCANKILSCANKLLSCQKVSGCQNKSYLVQTTGVVGCGEGALSCILRYRGIQLILAYS